VSAEAMGDAFRRSPYKGGVLLVHLAVADVVNDVHDNRLWMTRASLAEKARASRGTVDTAMAAMLRDGWLELVAEGGGRGKPTEYRYHLGGAAEKPPNHEAVSGDTAQPLTETAQPRESSPLSIPREPNEPTTTKERANTLAREWWESRQPRPLQPFMAVRGIIEKALAAGWDDEAVRRALAACQDDPPLVLWKIDKALTAQRRKQHPRGGLNDR
jgi:hypothetical protein